MQQKTSIIQGSFHVHIVAGTFSPGIEIWDLDVLDSVEPLATLGGPVAAAGSEAAQPTKEEMSAKGRKKKKKKAGKVSGGGDCHGAAHCWTALLAWHCRRSSGGMRSTGTAASTDICVVLRCAVSLSLTIASSDQCSCAHPWAQQNVQCRNGNAAEDGGASAEGRQPHRRGAGPGLEPQRAPRAGLRLGRHHRQGEGQGSGSGLMPLAPQPPPLLHQLRALGCCWWRPAVLA